MSTSVPPPNTPDPEPAPFELPRPPRRIPARVKALAGVAAAAVVAVVAVTAFGGGSGSTGPIGPVAQAATVSTAAPGEAVRMTMSMTVPGVSTPVTMTAGGTFNLRDRSGSLTMTMDTANVPQLAQAGGGGKFTMREIMKGTTFYMQFPAALMRELPGGKQWLSVDIAKLPGLSGLASLFKNPASSDPAEMLQYLRAASGGVTTVGQEQIGGVETTHYAADIALSRLVSALPAAERTAGQQMASVLQQAQVSQIPVNVWVDSQHLVRRMQMSYAMSQSGEAINANVTIDITHYGPEPTPAIPPADQVIDLSSLLGSLGTGSSTGGFFGG